MSVTDEAIARIREMIAEGRLKPGDRLPKEADLAALLGLSRNSLREAVRALSLIHVLDVRQGDGTYVTGLEPERLLEAVGFMVELRHDTSLLEVFEVRRLLEPAATARAAELISAEQLAELEQELLRAEGAHSVEELVAHDLDFHRMIVQAAGNQVLSALLVQLNSPTVRARVWRGLTQEGALERTLAEHRGLVAALRAGRADLAHACAMVHIAGVEEWLRASVEAGEQPPASGGPSVG
ncbi:FadR/GntR family transcriptional regulator [Streptacidiphilus albus]|uniref:FadR/GntR family transcriptional regulator n=1 Tax=Streptacidiphilus albus TaxID=105425 RepID=UPI00054C1DC5|nr:FadR/GntR family transcriptional regulator [Streptacidiphilus albus]